VWKPGRIGCGREAFDEWLYVTGHQMSSIGMASTGIWRKRYGR